MNDRRLVELSHPIRDGMITYPGLPGPEITDHVSREQSEASRCLDCHASPEALGGG